MASLPGGATDATLNSVSCPAAGYCTASGYYGPGTLSGSAFVVSEAAGTWGDAAALQGTALDINTAISCPDTTDCAVAVTVQTPTFGTALYTVDEAAGTWGLGQPLSLPSSAAALNAADTPLIGCISAGNCVIAGDLADDSSVELPFAAAETSSGKWGTAAVPPEINASAGIGAAQQLSCAPGGDCTLAGTDQSDSGGPIRIWTAVIGSDGTFNAARQPAYQADGNVVGLSCPQDGYCALGFDLHSQYLLGIEAAPATVAVTRSPATVTAGGQQEERLAVTVSSEEGGTPTGTIMVTGPAARRLCTITLVDGASSCSFPIRQFPVGTDRLTAAYSGGLTYVAAAGTATVTVQPVYRRTRVARFTVPATHDIHRRFMVSGIVQELAGRKWRGAAAASLALYIRAQPHGRWIYAGHATTGHGGAFSWSQPIYLLGKFAWQARVERTITGITEYEPSASAAKDSHLVDRTYVTHFVAIHLSGDTSLAAIIQDFPAAGGLHFVNVTGIVRFYYEPAGSSTWRYLGKARATKANRGSVAIEPAGTLDGRFRIVFPAQGNFMGSSGLRSLS